MKPIFKTTALAAFVALSLTACGSSSGSNDSNSVVSQVEVQKAKTSEQAKRIAENLKDMWGSDNICIKEKKKFGGKNLAWGLCGAGLGDLMVEFMQKMKMVGKSVKWSKIGFYFA